MLYCDDGSRLGGDGRSMSQQRKDQVHANHEEEESAITSYVQIDQVSYAHQISGAKLTTGKWRAHGDSLLARVGWPPLASRSSYLARKSLGGTLLDKRRQGE